MLSIIISIISLICLYSIFDKKDYKSGLIFDVILNIVVLFINGGFVSLSDSGVTAIIVAIGVVFIKCLIETAILYAAYNKTSSFIGYFFLSIVFILLFVVVLVIILVILMKNSNGITI